MLYSKPSSAPGARHYCARRRREAGAALGHTAAGGQQRTDLEPWRLLQGVRAHVIMRELTVTNNLCWKSLIRHLKRQTALTKQFTSSKRYFLISQMLADFCRFLPYL